MNASPSFDCAKARSKVDKMICGDAQLSSLDKKMSTIFSVALTQAPDQGELDRGDIQKLQKRWLRDRNDCDEVDCLKSSYDTRLDQLATLTGRFPSSTVRTLCARLEAPNTRTETLAAKAGADDINNDGKPETITTCTGGSGNVPCATYVDEDNQPVHVQPQGFELSTTAPLGRSAFRYENRTFIYHSRDAALAEPAYLSYIAPTNHELRICEYETNVGSAVAEGGQDVCAAVESDERIEPIEWANDDLQSRTIGRPETRSMGITAADIDNDGLDESVLELKFESSAGAGCAFNYFELLTEDRQALLENSNTIPVRDLQGLPPDGYRARDCGSIDNRLFKFADKVFYETNTSNNPLVPHEVRVLDGTAVATLCTLERQVTVRVKTIFSQ